MLTAERLREVLRYCPDTGRFIWQHSPKASMNGIEAGYVGADGYVRIKLEGSMCLAHRLAFLYMTGEWPPELVDHINGVKSDNRWSNLRGASSSENIVNRSHHVNNKLGLKNIFMFRGRYRVKIHSSVGVYDELFPDEVQAVDMASRMRTILHGEFAHATNIS